MKQNIRLQAVLSEPGSTTEQQLALFGLLTLGVVESLTGGSLSATEAVRVFFHGENCSFVRQHLRHRVADEVMSRGIQLPDLFDVLSAKEAQQEFQRELTTIRSLCLALLAEQRLAA